MTTRLVLENGTPLQMAGDATSLRALVVLQEAFGVNEHIRRLVDSFAREGFFVVAPELFHRTGSPEIAYDSFPDAMASLATLNASGLSEDLTATTSYLVGAGFPTASIAVVGYCMGGSVAFYAATLGIVGAATSFYGGGVEHGRFGLAPLVALAPSLKAPWLGLYGDLDKGIPVEQVESLRAATQTAPVPTDIVRYPNADHGFNCDARPAVFNAVAAKDATERVLAFFSTHLLDR